MNNNSAFPVGVPRRFTRAHTHEWCLASSHNGDVVMDEARRGEREPRSRPPQPGKRPCHPSGPPAAVKKHLPPRSVAAPLISAPQTGSGTRYALFLEARSSPRRTRASKVLAEPSIFRGAPSNTGAGAAFKGNLEQICLHPAL